MDPIVETLGSAHRAELAAHYLALASADRRLRFGVSLPDARIGAYVRGLDFARDIVFAVRDGEGALAGVTHLALWPGAGELGLSVRADQRGRGIAGAMFAQALVFARNRGVVELFMHCLTENAAMMHIARRAGMTIHGEGSESDAWLELPPADPASIGRELCDTQRALLAHAVRETLRCLAVVRAGRAPATPAGSA